MPAEVGKIKVNRGKVWVLGAKCLILRWSDSLCECFLKVSGQSYQKGLRCQSHVRLGNSLQCCLSTGHPLPVSGAERPRRHRYPGRGSASTALGAGLPGSPRAGRVALSPVHSQAQGSWYCDSD